MQIRLLLSPTTRRFFPSLDSVPLIFPAALAVVKSSIQSNVVI
jgi:hypothetical protein